MNHFISYGFDCLVCKCAVALPWLLVTRNHGKNSFLQKCRLVEHCEGTLSSICAYCVGRTQI